MTDGVYGEISEVESGKFEWKIQNFSFSEYRYISPDFKFEGESWCLSVFHNYIDKYMQLRLGKTSPYVFPIKVEFAVSVKTTEGRKKFERCERCFCEGWRYDYVITRWITISEFSNQQSEFLSSGCLTIILTMKRVDSEGSESARSEAMCSCCKKSLHEGIISFHKDCLNKEAKCPRCDEVVSLQNWFDHVCQMENVPAASAAEVCSCCKESRHAESLHKIPVHEKCLDQPIMCPNCVETVSLQNWFGHECQAANVKSESNTSQPLGSHSKDKTLHDFKQLFLNQENCDVLLRVQGKEFSAHKNILVARSPVFASTFSSNMKEKESGTVDIEDVDSNCFSDFLCFLYCGEIENLSFENVCSFFTAAEKYGITDLRTMCLEYTKEKLSDEIFLRKTYLDSFQC